MAIIYEVVEHSNENPVKYIKCFTMVEDAIRECKNKKDSIINQYMIDEKKVIDITTEKGCLNFLLTLSRFFPKDKAYELSQQMCKGYASLSDLKNDIAQSVPYDCKQDVCSKVDYLFKIRLVKFRHKNSGTINAMLYPYGNGNGGLIEFKNTIKVDEMENINTKVFSTIKSIWKQKNALLIINSDSMYTLLKDDKDKYTINELAVVKKENRTWFIGYKSGRTIAELRGYPETPSSSYHRVENTMSAISVIKQYANNL